MFKLRALMMLFDEQIAGRMFLWLKTSIKRKKEGKVNIKRSRGNFYN